MNRRWLFILVIPILAGLLGFWRYYEWREHRFDPVILEASQRYGVDPALVKAVAWRESWFNPRARGRAGELGLMQIRTAAAGDWAAAERLNSFVPGQLTDPGTNTLVGAWYLAKLLKRYRTNDNPIPYALADYNAGRGNVLRWNSGLAETNAGAFLAGMDFPGTRRYVNDVIRRYKKYQTKLKPTE